MFKINNSSTAPQFNSNRNTTIEFNNEFIIVQ